MRITVILLVINTTYYKSDACMWYDNGEGYRISMFRAEIEALYGYRSFYYTPNKLNAYLPRLDNNDRYKNCKEWRKLLGSDCRVRDIYKILYQTKPKEFLTAFDNKSLKIKYKDNSFIEALTSNNDWLIYISIAKINEARNEQIAATWNNDSYDIDDSNNDDKINAKNLIKQMIKAMNMTNNQDIKQRYAYHLIRAYRQQGNNDKAIELYNKYFADAKNTSILRVWAMLHYAEALNAKGEEAKANLFYSRIFSLGEEKRIRAYTLFNKNLLNETLAIAKDKVDISNIWAIMAIKTPGPALKEIKKVVANNAYNPAIPLLIMREINKLEDWIFTPAQTTFAPAMHYDSDFKAWQDNYKQIKQKNKAKDLQYLKEFNAYLKQISSQLNSKWKDFIIISRAHLSLIADDNKTALSLFKQISKNASNAITVQKHIELALYYTFEDKLANEKVKNRIAESLQMLEKFAKKDKFYYKQLYSLSEIISNAYFDKKDIVTAGLLKQKAINYKDKYNNNEWQSYYSKIAFFDRYGTTQDIDKLLKFIANRDKNTFSKYLCNQNLASKDAWLDLKGTIALRTGDIVTANNVFSAVKHNYWDKNYEFSSYLNKDPFIIPYYKFESGKKYKFNKADVVKQVYDYSKQAEQNPDKAGYYYMKIGNFFYNASYRGNSWMMLSYYNTCYPYYNYISYGYDMPFIRKHYHTKDYENSYFKCSIALQYYDKAEKVAKNKENIATILVMKHLCNYDRYLWRKMKSEDYKGKYNAIDIKKLYNNYKDTKVFAKVKCATLDYFAKG